jgi:hypothetical protein
VRRRIFRGILAVTVAGALVVAGCGGDDDDAARGTDLTALRCPLVATGNGDELKPAEDSFDTSELIGMSLAEARERAAEGGCEVVVSLEDGKGRPVPIEVDPERIYVYTEDGVVTEIEGVGGGI